MTTLKVGAFAGACAILGCGAASAANLLSNGDFEDSIAAVASGSYTKVVANSGAISGWTVSGNSVDLIRNAYNAINSVSVDLAGSPGPGGLSQSFAAIAGYTYELKWDYFKNGGFGNLLVSVGTSSVNITSEPSAAVFGQTLLFTAPTSGSFNVSFSTSVASNNGPVIDNIQLTVSAVPEASEWAMMLAGLGVIGLITRRRSSGARA